MLDGGSNPQANFFYDDLRRRTAVQRYGVVTTYGFDSVSRLASLTQDFPGGTTNDLTQTLSYNPAGQIRQVVRSNDAYAFTGFTSGTTTSTSDGLNRIATITGGTPTYDARGNLTSDPTTGRTYGYSSENRLTSASGGVTLSYDSLGRLYQVASGSGTRRFLYATGESGLPEPVSEFNGSNALTNHYVFGPGVDEPIMAGDFTVGGVWSLLFGDERGSIVSVSDTGGNVLAKNKYDEFGVPQIAASSGKFLYTGQMWLPEAGVYHYKARAYLPTWGRFMQTDPIGYPVGANLYSYVMNDPVNFSDSLGFYPNIDPITVTGTKDKGMEGTGAIQDAIDSLIGNMVPSAAQTQDSDVIEVVGERLKQNRPLKPPLILTANAVDRFCAAFSEGGSPIELLTALLGGAVTETISKFTERGANDALWLIEHGQEVEGSRFLPTEVRTAIRARRAGLIGMAAGGVAGYIFKDDIDRAIQLMGDTCKQLLRG